MSELFFRYCTSCGRFFQGDTGKVEYADHQKTCGKSMDFSDTKKHEFGKPELNGSFKNQDITPPLEKIPVSDEKERRKQLLVAMKTRLGTAKVDCATLKFDATKDLYIKKFGAGEYTKLERSFNGEMNNV